MNRTTFLRYLYISLLTICVAIHASHFLSFSYHSPIDFRNVYLAGKLWLANQNAYDDAVLKSAWLQICETEKITFLQAPGLPSNFLVYPPAALLAYAPLGLLSWKVASIFNLVLCIVALIFTLRLSLLLSETRARIGWILLLVFAFKGTFHALLVGQPTFFVLLFGMFSIYAATCLNKKISAGIALGLAAIKPTLMLPFALYLLNQRQWKTLFCGAGVSIIMNGVALLFFAAPCDLITGFQHNIQLLKHTVIDQQSVYYMSTLTDITVWVNYLMPSATWIPFLTFIFMVTLLCLAWMYRTKDNGINNFHLFAALTLLLTYHLFYDTLLLIPFCIAAVTLNEKQKRVLALLTLPLFIPVNGILDRVPHPEAIDWLYLHLPMVIFTITAFIYLTQQPSVKE